MTTQAARHAMARSIRSRLTAVGTEIADGLLAQVVDAALDAIAVSEPVRACVADLLAETATQRLYDQVTALARQAGLYVPPRPQLLGELQCGPRSCLVSFDGMDPRDLQISLNYLFNASPIEGVQGRASIRARTESSMIFQQFVQWAESERRVVAMWHPVASGVAA